jgi:hypothetical protein
VSVIDEVSLEAWPIERLEAEITLVAAHLAAGWRSISGDRQRQAGPDRAWRLPPRSLVTEQSLRVELANTKEQLRQLQQEIGLLRDRLARNLGAEADLARGRASATMLDQLETRATQLAADNAGLQRRLTQLEGELREANDSLDAARTANRDLMNMLNR